MAQDSGSILLRPAAIADIPQLAALLDLLFSQEADFTPDAEKQSRALRLIIEQPEIGCIYCAADAEKIVGMVNLLLTVSTAEGGRVAILEDLIVHPDHRRDGIGKQLLLHAITAARAAGCLRITLLTDSTNALALQFYKNAGFTASQMVPFRLKL
jgi:ribosomal protein S18 acetylase RimI-like enzyme